MPSIGTATGTRVDSAAKHIMACKVDSHQLARWIPGGNIQLKYGEVNSYLHNSKMKWCMHKDEIVLNTTKKISPTADSFSKAYPLVVSTAGEMHVITKKAITHLYAQKTASDFFQTIQDYTQVSREFDKVKTLLFPHPQKPPAITEEDKECVKTQVSTLPDFRCQGIALGQAWASYLSGDTVASVLVGGMVTVQNGHFTMHTGDEVQWYFDWEAHEFNGGMSLHNGFRSNLSEKRNENKRKHEYFDQRLYGTGPSYGKSMGQKDTSTVVRIKSYRIHTEDGSKVFFDHFGDKVRIFAKCISGGRPLDMVDIMLMTQSS
jgi:hypothetical protein